MSNDRSRPVVVKMPACIRVFVVSLISLAMGSPVAGFLPSRSFRFFWGFFLARRTLIRFRMDFSSVSAIAALPTNFHLVSRLYQRFDMLDGRIQDAWW